MFVKLVKRRFKHVNGIIKPELEEIIIKDARRIEIEDNVLFIDYLDSDGKVSDFSKIDEIKSLILEE